MKRVFVVMLIAAMMSTLATPAMAITHFKKIWGEHYTPKGDEPGAEDVDPEFMKISRKAGCNLCHVKGEDKKKVRNEYGEALHKYLKAEDFSKDRIKAEPDKVKEEIIAALKKVADVKNKEGDTFGERIKANKLPATDANLE